MVGSTRLGVVSSSEWGESGESILIRNTLHAYVRRKGYKGVDNPPYPPALVSHGAFDTSPS